MSKVSSGRFRHLIEEHFDNLELDVVCRKKRHAYAIYWADDHQPLARLRPTGRSNEVEVYHWDDDHWWQVGEAGLVLPLEESLEFITNDPEGLFFDDDEQRGFEIPATTPDLVTAVRSLHRHVLICTAIGGFAGGLFSGPILGVTCAALAGILFCTGVVAIRGNIRTILPHTIVVGIPVSLVAGAGGVLGGGLNSFVSHGIWGPICGLVIGGFSSLLMFGGGWISRAIGFMAGLTLAARLVELAGLREQFAGLMLVALAASLGGTLYGWLAQQYMNSVKPILSPQVDGE